MTKGTTSSGLRHIKTHTLCRRCGRKTFHKQKKQCSSCGFPEAKMRFYNWSLKVRRRRGYGTGRLRYEGTLDRRFNNGFREGKKPKDRTKHVKA